MNNSKYKQKIADIMEILSPVFEPYWDNELKNGEIKDILMYAAGPMVAEMAKEYELAYFSNYHGTEDSDDYAMWNQNCIYEMQERGLIPNTEKIDT